MPEVVNAIGFEANAEEAVDFYVSTLPGAKRGETTRYGAAGPGPAGSVMTAAFSIGGNEYVAFNGGPHFKFTDAFSICVLCETQEEIDTYWARLSEGGQEGPCGWLKDRFGLWWQVNPDRLLTMLADPDPARARRVYDAMLTMKKIDLAALECAYDGPGA